LKKGRCLLKRLRGVPPAEPFVIAEHRAGRRTAVERNNKPAPFDDLASLCHPPNVVTDWRDRLLRRPSEHARGASPVNPKNPPPPQRFQTFAIGEVSRARPATGAALGLTVAAVWCLDLGTARLGENKTVVRRVADPIDPSGLRFQRNRQRLSRTAARARQVRVADDARYITTTAMIAGAETNSMSWAPPRPKAPHLPTPPPGARRRNNGSSAAPATCLALPALDSPALSTKT